MQQPRTTEPISDKPETIKISNLVNCTGRKLTILAMEDKAFDLPPVLDLFVQCVGRPKALFVTDDHTGEEVSMVVLEQVDVVTELPPPKAGVYYIVDSASYDNLKHFRDDVLEPTYSGKDGGTMVVSGLTKVRHYGSKSEASEFQDQTVELPPNYFLTLDAMIGGALQSQNINICNMSYQDAEDMVYPVFHYLAAKNNGKYNISALCQQAVDLVLNGGVAAGKHDYQLASVTYNTKELLSRLPERPVSVAPVSEVAILTPMLALGNRMLNIVHEMTGYQINDMVRVKFSKLMFDEFSKVQNNERPVVSHLHWEQLFNRILKLVLSSMDHEVDLDAPSVLRDIIARSWAETPSLKN